jgi:hypothetical protein
MAINTHTNVSASGGASISDDRINVSDTHTPATAGAAGKKGDIAYDADFIYVCVATNTWKRVAIATW